MQISGNRKPVFTLIAGILAAAILLLNMPVSPIYAAADNPEGKSISFPEPGITDTMETNFGTITTLYSKGTITYNRGVIEESDGTVLENHGVIEKLMAPNVGINYGKIESIDNTGSLGVNALTGVVEYNGNGNTIKRNEGQIVENRGIVSKNYHQIDKNYGTVVMYDDSNGSSNITTNFSYGMVTFEGAGSVENNDGNIVISGAAVTVTNNAGTITLLNNASLTCGYNYGSIVKADEAAVYNCECRHNYGTIGFTENSNGKTVSSPNLYKIAFSGDDGKANVTLCEADYAGNNYTMIGHVVEFSLPNEYACTNATLNESSSVEGRSDWYINTESPDENNKVFTVVCHRCSADGYERNETTHRQVCSECRRLLCEGSHSFGDYVSDNNATCITDGTKTRKCEICGYADTVTDEGSHLTSNNHNVVIDPGVPATETQTGLTEGSHCADCHKVLVAQSVIPRISHICVPYSGYFYNADSHWQTCSSCGSVINPESHRFGDFISNNDATCTTDGTKTRVCSVCSYSETVTDTGSHLTSDKHTPETDPAKEDSGSSPVKDDSATAGTSETDISKAEAGNSPVKDDSATAGTSETDISKADSAPIADNAVGGASEAANDVSAANGQADNADPEDGSGNVVPIAAAAVSVAAVGAAGAFWGLKHRRKISHQRN